MNSSLISPASLAEAIAARSVVLIDARPSRAAYDAGHLPGALHADLDTQLSAASDVDADPARGGRHPLPPLDRWLRQLGEWGITPERRVVAYDDQSGANAAARLWWMLRAVGHQDVAVLDGGLAAALAAGLELTTAVPELPAAPRYPADGWMLPTASREEVDRWRNDPSRRIVDVRSAERYRGETEPIDPIAGHIPGAVNLPFAGNLRNGSFRSREELRALYLPLLGEIDPSQLVIHCGSGVTACHTLLALEEAGLPGASLYVGSWSEWCRNDLPREP